MTSMEVKHDNFKSFKSEGEGVVFKSQKKIDEEKSSSSEKVDQSADESESGSVSNSGSESGSGSGSGSGSEEKEKKWSEAKSNVEEDKKE